MPAVYLYTIAKERTSYDGVERRFYINKNPTKQSIYIRNLITFFPIFSPTSYFSRDSRFRATIFRDIRRLNQLGWVRRVGSSLFF